MGFELDHLKVTALLILPRRENPLFLLPMCCYCWSETRSIGHIQELYVAEGVRFIPMQL